MLSSPQLNELKPELDAVKKENKRLKELLKQSKVREGNVEQAIESSKVRELTEKASLIVSWQCFVRC